MHHLIILAFFLSLNLTQAKSIDYASFEQEVLTKNKAAIGLKNNIDVYQKKINEPSLLVSPYLFTNFLYSHDERETINPQFMGVFTNARLYEVGIKQQTPWGQQYILSYKAQYTDLSGALLTNASAYEVGPQLELTQSLWRNFFGSETRAQQNIIRAQNSMSYYQDLFAYQQLLRQTKLLYLNLFIAKESVRLQTEGLKRAKEIRDWTKNRRQRELGEESDYLQAQAQVLSKEFEVKSAEDQLSTVAKKFQVMRGEEGEVVIEDVKPLDQKELLNFTTVKEYKPRADIEIFKAQLEMSKSQSVLSGERYKPQLEVFGKMAYQGREPAYDEAKEEAFDKEHEWWAVGVRFSAPIFFLDAADTIKAYDVQEKSAESQIEQRDREALSDWKRLNQELINQKEKYLIGQQLVEIQRKKSDVERRKLKQGRTTTYQVLTFELDYLNSELLFLKSQSDLMNVGTELSLYQ